MAGWSDIVSAVYIDSRGRYLPIAAEENVDDKISEMRGIYRAVTTSQRQLCFTFGLMPTNLPQRRWKSLYWLRTANEYGFSA